MIHDNSHMQSVQYMYQHPNKRSVVIKVPIYKPEEIDNKSTSVCTQLLILLKIMKP